MGSGGAKRAQRAASAAEAERQALMQRSVDRINGVFDAPGRLAGRQDFLAAVRENFLRNANKQKELADRRLKFAMARSGLAGGSAQADSNRTLGEEYTEGVLKAEQKSQGALADLEGQDEAARLNLISMARQGLDATTAAQRAGSAIRSNADSAKADALSGGLGDIFGSTAGIYKQAEEGAARRRGEREAAGSLYGNKNPWG